MAKSEDIVDHILEKIRKGELKAGDRMPTHRDLAWDMKCSVGTVTRAYAELERRGVIYGQVGRGTYVYGTGEDRRAVGSGLFIPEETTPENRTEETIDLSLNRFFHPGVESAYREALHAVGERKGLEEYRDYFDCRGRAVDKLPALNWLGNMTGLVDERNLLFTQGAQSGLYLTMSALTNQGDAIATEEFGYPGIKAIAQELGLRISAVDMDDEGMVPASFEALARRGKIKLLITVPTNHNPTGTTLPTGRRREIAKIANDNGILIVEDGVYNPLQKSRLPTFREIDPENAIYLTSFSKLFSPGLRVGYVVAPELYMPKLINRMTVINWMTSPVTLDVCNYLMDKGIMANHQNWLLKECERRFNYARGLFSAWISEAQKNAPIPLSQLWVRLPATMESSDFLFKARQQGILLIGGDRFAMNRQIDDHYVRICLMGVSSFSHLKQALGLLRGLLIESETRALIS
ncbi:MAG: PLP-dependent aminotransferase family protein [Sneathiellales bacterium]|nr:PLP-dependent aminotransferase family protein [Sneathiellales bacterium]